MSRAEEKPAPQPVDPDHAKKMARGLDLFKSDVRAVLVKHCVECHGGEKLKADFDLTSRESLLKGGESGEAVLPGKGAASLMVKLLTHKEEPHMPSKQPKLPDAVIAKVTEWIDLGAPYDKPLIDKAVKVRGPMQVTDKDRQFWSFQPLKRVESAALAGDNWSRTPLDRFVLAKLREKKLEPNAAASKRVLIRRAYLGLIGLPPTPEEVDAFVKDADPKAWEKVIDKLLDSPHHGERWARHWLDVARFAESHGFEQDYDRPHAYHYRDFVIKAFNAGMPFDQFVKWQVAGDELAPNDPLAMMATGFLGAGVFPTQLTEKEFESARYDELDDMTGTLGTAMLGMTVGCARCHDHKFDPIPTRDYYRMVSTFTTTIRSEIDLELNADKVSDAMKAWQAEHPKIEAALKDYEKANITKEKLAAWVKQASPRDIAKPTWVTLSVDAKSHGGATFQPQDDGSLLATGTSPANDKWTFTAKTNLTGITAVKLEALADKSLVRGGPGRASNGNFALSVFKVSATPARGLRAPVPKPTEIKLVSAKATFEQNNNSLSVKSSIDGDNVSGWAVDPQFGKNHAAVFEFEKPVGFSAEEGGTILTFEFEFNNNTQHSIGRPRLSITTQAGPVPIEGEATPQKIVELFAAIKQAGSVDKLSDAQLAEALAWYRNFDPKWNELNAKVKASLAAKPKPQTAKVMVTSEGFKPMKHHADDRGFPHFYKQTHLLNRGDVNQKTEAVTQGFLQVATRGGKDETYWQNGSASSAARTSGRRTALAHWMTDTENGAGHLLARVIVNRLWQHHLGRGIVGTPNDFGMQGDRPTHPELLDYLATELIKSDWRLKPIHKLIMTSSVYMQSSDHDAAKSAIDSGNALLWRANYQRLEAEAIRDSMLAVSGELDRTMFGPGTLSEGMKRRSIYFFIKRSQLVPIMTLFDMPEPLTSQGSRPATTIAPQALLFMNNPQVRMYAVSFAKRIGANASPEDAVKRAYVMALSREPSKAEIEDNVAFIAAQQASYEAAKKGNARDLALADFCQVMFCLNEFVYVE